MLGKRDVGHRVVVRRYVGIGETGRALFTDLLGELIGLDGGQAVIRTHDGTEHTVAIRDITNGKRVPPRQAKYSEIADLERVADEAWPAPERERLGEWILRAADGFTNRANSALPLGDPGLPLDDAIDAVAAWYRARGLTPRILSPLPVCAGVESRLAQRGWLAKPPVLVQVAALNSLDGNALAGSLPEGSPEVELRREPTDAFLAQVSDWKEGLPEVARRVLTAVRRVRFAHGYDEQGALVAIGRGAIAGNGTWLHIGLVEVAPEHRRRGLAATVTRVLARWGARSSATRAVLQVEEGNEPAVALYARLGFQTHHRYVTRLAPD